MEIMGVSLDPSSLARSANDFCHSFLKFKTKALDLRAVFQDLVVVKAQPHSGSAFRSDI